MRETGVAVVGAGPAGLSAALAAAQAGAQVTVVDEYPRPGGQFYKQLPAEFRTLDRSALDSEYTKGHRLLEAVAGAGVELLTDTLVWGCFEPGVLELATGARTDKLRARKVIVASGAYDRPVAFPGWDLPGVITAGAAQTLAKSQRVLPGRSILLVGSGPFLLPVAKALLAAGGQIRAILEATSPRSWARHAPRLRGHWARLREGWDYLRAIRRAGVPMAYGWVIVRAEGEMEVERAIVARCDVDWRPIPGTERRLAVDTICLGYGFLPNTQLTRLLGCEHVFRRRAGGWVPVHDPLMRTSVPDVLVAGEVAGIGGSAAALAEGALAGLSAAQDLGYAVLADRLAAAQRGRRHARAFGDLVNELFEIRPGVYELMGDEVVVCRCEEVTAGEVRATLCEWTANVNVVKAITRAGMGPCQGRICGNLVAELTARGSSRSVDQVDYFHVRPPLKPLPLYVLEQVEPESEAAR